METGSSSAALPAIDPDRVYVMAEVAALMFNRPAPWFGKRRRALEAIGFPKPVSPKGRPRWRGWQLIDWFIISAGRPDQAPTPAGISALLQRRAREAAQGGRPRKQPRQVRSARVIPFRKREP